VLRKTSSQKDRVLDLFKTCLFNQNSNIFSNIKSLELPSLTPLATLCPLYSSKVRAGFPSPADDHLEKRLDLTEYLIKQPDATFFITITGDSMRDAGILSGDKAIVDRSKKAKVGDIVLAVLDGEFTVKTLGKTKQGTAKLIPANPDYPIVEIKEEMQFEVWGVVVATFRKY
jgi:DNA polymerase V